jgi:hypothetical protein
MELCDMDAFPKVSAEELKRFLHSKVDDVAEKIIESMNAARVGELISDTEEPVRRTLHEFGRAAFEAAVQQKLSAAEAAFPPSGGCDVRKEDGE